MCFENLSVIVLSVETLKLSKGFRKLEVFLERGSNG